MTSLVAIARRWWPIPLSIALSVMIQTVAYTGRYDVDGHAAEHLGSGSFVFLASVVAGLLLWTTPRARRSPVVIGGLITWLSAGVAIAIGNVLVVDALIRAGEATTPTTRLSESQSVSDAHWLANTAPFAAVAGAFIVVLGIYLVRAASLGLTVAAVLLNVLVPYWIAPGFGLVVVAGARIIATEKAARGRPLTARDPSASNG